MKEQDENHELEKTPVFTNSFSENYLEFEQSNKVSLRNESERK